MFPFTLGGAGTVLYCSGCWFLMCFVSFQIVPSDFRSPFISPPSRFLLGLPLGWAPLTAWENIISVSCSNQSRPATITSRFSTMPRHWHITRSLSLSPWLL